jgi:ankyrin repeat protein
MAADRIPPDPLFVFNAANHTVEIHGEYRETGSTQLRRNIRFMVSEDLNNAEKAIERFGTRAYKRLTKRRRDEARRALRNVAPPGGAAAGPPAGVTGQMDAGQAGDHMLANGGGFVLGYNHNDQDSKDFTTELIRKAGGNNLKHLFIEELPSEMQGEINAFLADPAGVMPPSLQNRIKELQGRPYFADFEPMLYAAREKGVKIWGIDTSKADPQCDKTDPRYHERRLVVMNAEVKRINDGVRRDYPNEPILALTGQAHVNTAEGGVPGLAQIMGLPGVALDPNAKRLAFLPEDTSKRARLSSLERDCAEGILKRAAADYKNYTLHFHETNTFQALPDPKPQVGPFDLNMREVTTEAQRLVAQFVAAGRLNAHADIDGLVADAAVNAALLRIFRTTMLRNDRRQKLSQAIQTGQLPYVRTALDADPYLLKMPVDETKLDTLLHAACDAGHPAVVQELIARGGINVNATDLCGQAPIHRLLAKADAGPAGVAGLATNVAQLLAGGANPNLANPSGKTGLELAKTGPLADSQLVESFVAGGAAPATDLFVSKFVALAKAQYAGVRAEGGVSFDADDAQQAAIALTVSLPTRGVPLGNPAQVTTALGNGAVTAELTRLTALFSARAARMRQAVAAIEAKDLAGLQATLNADPRLAHIPLRNEQMALGMAAVEGDGAAMDELIRRGVSVDQKSPRGRTALHEVLAQEVSKTNLAAQAAVANKAQALIARGADVNARNGRGETALHLAGFRNNRPMITALRALTSPPAASVPDLNARDNRGWTPIDTAMASTNLEAENLLHTAPTGVAPPLKAGRLSTVDILVQATRCEDSADAHKARKFIEQIYANADLRPMLHLAAAAACNNHHPPNGGLRLFASKDQTVGELFGRSVGPTAAYDEKVDTLLFPLQDGEEGDAVGSLAHELTHFTAHFVTSDLRTVPFSDGPEEAQYRAAIEADVRKIQLLDESDPVQKLIKNRFSGRMASYQSKPATGEPKNPAEFDTSLLQEFVVGVPQVAAVYGMDELAKHLPNLVGYYRNVWTPKMNLALASDPRLAPHRAKIDVAANGRVATALAANPDRQPKPVTPVMVPKGDPRLDLDRLMEKIEADFVATRGQPGAGLGGRTVVYRPADMELSQADKDDFAKKKPAVRSALKKALAGENFPPDIDLGEVRKLVEGVTGTVIAQSGDDLKTALNNRAINWVKDAKSAYVDRQIETRGTVKPRDMAEAIAYRAEAQARVGLGADLDPDTEIKEAKQKDLIKGLAKSLADPDNTRKLQEQPQNLLNEVSDTLSRPDVRAVYMKAGATTHVSVDVKAAKTAWMTKLHAIV